MAATGVAVVEELNKFSCSFGDGDAEWVLMLGRIVTGCCKCKNDGLICDDEDVPLFSGQVNGAINGWWDAGDGVVAYGK